MKEKTKSIIKSIIPPSLLRLAQKKPNYGFFGNYKTWEEAKKDSVGYDAVAILEKVKNSLLMVKEGKAVYERDSKLFDKIQYSWPVLASLLWIATKNENKLNIVDFGGSLGSTYFQNIEFLKHLKKIRWSIVEQKNFVDCGKKNFEDDYLKFYNSIDDCLKEDKPEAFLLLSVLQYLEDPYAFLEKLISYDFKHIVVDRTLFLKDSERITIQKVPSQIYPASYPAWFINETKFLNILKKKYKLVSDFDALGGIRNLGDVDSFEKGYIFIKK